MPISAISLPISFKGVQRNFKDIQFPEIDPSYKYLFDNAPEGEPISLKASRGLNLLA